MLPVPRTDKKTVVYIIDRVDTLGKAAVNKAPEGEPSESKRGRPEQHYYSLKARKHNKSRKKDRRSCNERA